MCTICEQQLNLGISVITPDKKDNKEWVQKLRGLKKQLRKKKMVLGNGVDTQNVEEAAEAFFRREWPELRGSVFIPTDYFISLCPEIICNPGSLEGGRRKKVEEEFKNEFISGRFHGDLAERAAFETLTKLKSLFQRREMTSQNVVIIHGWKNRLFTKDDNQKDNIEADYIIICEKSRSIIYLEVKSTATNDNLKKVKEQHESILKEFRAIPAAAGWSFVKSVYFGSSMNEQQCCCHYCHRFVLTKDSDIKAWWESCTFPDETGFSNMKSEFREIVKWLTFMMHAFFPKSVVTRSQAGNRVMEDLNTKVGTKDNILLWAWTEEQCSAFYTDHKRVLFTSPAGTGKTVLLLEKCIEVAIAFPEKKVYYIIGSSYYGDTIFSKEKQYQFSKLKQENLVVVDMSNGDNWEYINNFICKCIKDGNVAAFFLDELSPNVVLPFKSLSNNLNGFDGHLWIALGHVRWIPAVKQPLLAEILEDAKKCGFVTPDLRENLRSVLNVCNVVKELGVWKLFDGEVIAAADTLCLTATMKINGPEPVQLYAKLKYDLLFEDDRVEHTEEIKRLTEEGLDRLSDQSGGDLDDLLIVMDTCLYPGSYWSTIRDVCHKRHLTTHLASRVKKSKDLNWFFENGRRGVVIADDYSVPGCEFKSVMAFIHVDRSKGGVTVRWNLTRECILRSICNLVVIQLPSDF